jgi:hypothetical protein
MLTTTYRRSFNLGDSSLAGRLRALLDEIGEEYGIFIK